jgi:hypothetical protein
MHEREITNDDRIRLGQEAAHIKRALESLMADPAASLAELIADVEARRLERYEAEVGSTRRERLEKRRQEDDRRQRRQAACEAHAQKDRAEQEHRRQEVPLGFGGRCT